MEDPDPTLKQALKETFRESLDTIRSLWWVWLIALLTLAFFLWLMWFFTNFGPGSIYRKIGAGEFPD